jgi:hypothetical protein
MADWLEDLLKKDADGKLENKKIIGGIDQRQRQWESFHYATRLKIEGAIFYCRNILGLVEIPDELGTPSLAYHLTEWYTEAFFHQLMSMFDTLLQEINIVYQLGYKSTKVRYQNESFRDSIPASLKQSISSTFETDWFTKIRNYRNTSTHIYKVPLSSGVTFMGNLANYTEHQVKLVYSDQNDNLKTEEIKIILEYLKHMIMFTQDIWQIMSSNFE